MRRCTRPWAFAGLVLVSGCTLDAGVGFATLERAELATRFASDSRADRGEGTVVTELGYHVAVDRLSLMVAAIEIEQLAQGETEDEAAECHGGHCHDAHAEPASEEETHAEHGDAAGHFTPIVALPIDRALDVLAAERVALEDVAPSRELPMSVVSRVSVEVERIELIGRVSAGALEDREIGLTLDVPMSSRMTADVDRRIDRNAPAELTLEVTVTLDARLFDGVEFAEIAGDPELLSGDGSPVREAVVTAVAATIPEVSFGNHHAHHH